MDDADPEITYRHLLDLWTSGVRDYHSLLSDYLTANSIFVAAIGFLLARQPMTLIFMMLVIVLCLFGVLMTLQMAIVLGRFSAQTALWEWHLRGIETARTQRQGAALDGEPEPAAGTNPPAPSHVQATSGQLPMGSPCAPRMPKPCLPRAKMWSSAGTPLRCSAE